MTPDSVKAEYAATLKERVSIRRYTGTGTSRPMFDAEARARVTGFAPQELVGTVVQGDRKAIVFVDDLIMAGLALPVTTNDKCVLSNGRELAIIAADGETRKIDNVLIAYELQVRG